MKCQYNIGIKIANSQSFNLLSNKKSKIDYTSFWEIWIHKIKALNRWTRTQLFFSSSRNFVFRVRQKWSSSSEFEFEALVATQTNSSNSVTEWTNNLKRKTTGCSPPIACCYILYHVIMGYTICYQPTSKSCNIAYRIFERGTACCNHSAGIGYLESQRQ